ncbi:MAG TPA: PAS domain S-box protein, partial [Thermoplasmata archaeon]|nr:PAS domain S-box protein [Thermoplasmata archaeon]
EEEIARTKTYFETLLEGVATPIWLFDLDGAVTYANSTSEEILGYKKEECVGNSLDEFLSKFIRTKEIPEAKQLIKEGTMLEKKIRTRVYSLLSKEGAEIPTLVSYVPIVNPKGERMGLIITATDISELRNTQEELDETKQFASSLFSNFSLPASLFNTIGERLDVNKASVRFFKRSREDLIGAKLEDLYEKEDTFKLLDALSECKKYGQSTCEVTAIKGDGTRVPTISYFSPIENKLGEVTRIIGVLHIA